MYTPKNSAGDVWGIKIFPESHHTLSNTLESPHNMRGATNVNYLDMWRQLLTVTLCATIAGGFDIPFACPTSVQTSCTPNLDSLASATCYGGINR